MRSLRTSAMAAIAMAVSSASAQVFTGLGFMPGDTSSQAQAVSADGTTVVGHGPVAAQAGYTTAWRWRPGIPLELVNTHANAVSLSANGDRVAGWSTVSATSFPAYLWTASDGPMNLPGVFSAAATAPGISGDGQVVVASSSSNGTSDPVRWTSATGAVIIPNPPTTPVASGNVTNALATNHDGSVVVGTMFAVPTGQPLGYVAPFRWVAGSGTQAITDGDGVPIHGAPLSVSADGNTVLIAGSTAQRWTAATGLQDIPGLSINGSQAYPAMSGDGGTIVSLSMVWSESAGTQEVTTLLASAGCNFSGWSNLIVTGTDFGGHTFCGYGTDPQGLTQAWYATIPSPAPLALLGLATLARRRR